MTALMSLASAGMLARAKAGARLAQWNAQYRAVWFRFPICAGHHDQTSISAEFDRRLPVEPVVEYRTAWTEIAAIMASPLAVRLQVLAMPV
jgi:2-oxo-4-hydroxy-4-carboxy--5-ureidoimidazoline (OHCU) decarboxylase